MDNIPLDNNSTTRKDIEQYINKLTNAISTTLNENVPTKAIDESQIGLPKLVRDMTKDKKIYNKNWQDKCNKLELKTSTTHGNT